MTASSSLRYRCGLLGLVVAALAAIFLLVPARPAAALPQCPGGGVEEFNTLYYSSPAHTTQVGEYYVCTHSLVGQSSAYSLPQLVCCSAP